jgi:hypothetical protein
MDRWYMVFDKPLCNNREIPLYFLRKLWDEFILGKHVNCFDIGDFQGVGLAFSLDREHVRCDCVLGPCPPRKRPDPPTQHTLVAEILQQVKLSISSLNCILVQHSSFVALPGKEVSTSEIDRGVGGSTCMTDYNEERAHEHSIRPCEPHRCSSCGSTCYWPIQPSGQHSFMEVSNVTLFMLLIVMCIYIYFLLCVFILIFYLFCSAFFTP